MANTDAAADLAFAESGSSELDCDMPIAAKLIAKKTCKQVIINLFSISKWLASSGYINT